VRIKELSQNSFEIPLGARHAAEKIEAERAVLGKGVTSEMRLREKAKAGDPSRTRKLMPLRFANGSKLHLPDDVVE
jgi:hypothetical protein